MNAWRDVFQGEHAGDPAEDPRRRRSHAGAVLAGIQRRNWRRLRSFSKGSGGNFYLTQAARVSKRFARAPCRQHTRRPDAAPRRVPHARLLEARDLPGARTQPGGSLMAYLSTPTCSCRQRTSTTASTSVPAFWDWLIASNAAKRVFSIEKVGDEIDAGDDELSVWAAQRGAGFFLKPDPSMLPALGQSAPGQRLSATNLQP